MRPFLAGVLVLWLAAPLAPTPARQPHVVDGLAQPVFDAATVIRHDVWVEIPGLDSDRDGRDDRIRVSIASVLEL